MGAELTIARDPTDRFGQLFAALIATLLLAPFFGGGPLQRAALVVIVGFVTLASLRATGVHSRPATLTIVIVGIAVMVSAFTGGATLETIVLVTLAIGMALGPPNIVRRILEHDEIRLQLVIAALCAYVQIGFAFAFGFAAIDRITAGDILAGGGGERFFDYVYFSFITMTTVGYGDITATTDPARALAIVETLIGQVFLVVLVAYLVGKLSGRRRPNVRHER